MALHSHIIKSPLRFLTKQDCINRNSSLYFQFLELWNNQQFLIRRNPSSNDTNCLSQVYEYRKYRHEDQKYRNKNSDGKKFGHNFGIFTLALTWIPFLHSKDKNSIEIFSENREENMFKLSKLLAEYIPSYTFIFDFVTLFFDQGDILISKADKQWLQTRFDEFMKVFLRNLKSHKYSDVFFGEDSIDFITKTQNEMKPGHCNSDSKKEYTSRVESMDKHSVVQYLENEILFFTDSSHGKNKMEISEGISDLALQHYTNIMMCLLGLFVEGVSDDAAFHHFFEAASNELPFAVWKCGMILELANNKEFLQERYNVESLIKDPIQTSANTEDISPRLWKYAAGNGFSNAYCDIARVADDTRSKVHNLEEAIARGSLRAKHELGLLYLKDPRTKIQLGYPLLESASKGHYPPALYSYGKLAFLGEISSLSAGQGVKLLEESASLGFPEAMFSLSYIYEKFDHDTDSSIRMLRKAAAGGHCEAQFELAMCYNLGNRTPQNIKKALELLSSASQAGHREARYQLAHLHELGRGTQKNMEIAFELYSNLAEDEDPRSLFKVGMFLYNGWGIDKNEEEGLKYIYRSAQLENADACHWLGNFYENDDMHLAYEWYNKALNIDHNHKEARSKRRKFKYKILNAERQLDN